MSKFTQGEWRVVATGAHWNNPKLQNLQICYSDDGECVCDTVYEKVDAHLISAAPDMYRALRGLLDVIDWPADFPERIKAAEAALAKADGEV